MNGWAVSQQTVASTVELAGAGDEAAFAQLVATGRIVCQAGNGGVTAFSAATGQWRQLLESGPAPTMPE